MAAAAEQDRHLMSHTYYQRCSFLVPMRWLRAGVDPITSTNAPIAP